MGLQVPNVCSDAFKHEVEANFSIQPDQIHPHSEVLLEGQRLDCGAEAARPPASVLTRGDSPISAAPLPPEWNSRGMVSGGVALVHISHPAADSQTV